MRSINRGSAIPAGVLETLAMTALTYGAAAGLWLLGRMSLMADLAARTQRHDPRENLAGPRR